jgi:RHH-type proline utilization regulon transcriptional repressor/proline dehydrogenase/delta 1-pyrroline-5-carboxylate dehydrogenase
MQSIRAGNLYVNRGTTGAIALRQPFGGVGRSSVGPGMKAGGPNYVAQLMRFIGSASPTRDGRILDERLRSLAAEIQSWKGPAEEIKRMLSALRSYDYQARIEFHREHDHFQLVGQDNIRRYLAVPRVHVRIHPDDTPFDIIARVAAAKAAGSRVVISSPPDVAETILNWLHDATESWAADIEFLEQDDEQLQESLSNLEVNRLRYADPSRVPEFIRQTVPGTNIHIADEPVLEEGRIELLRYVEEQSLSIDYHRYGNLGARAREALKGVG